MQPLAGEGLTEGVHLPGAIKLVINQRLESLKRLETSLPGGLPGRLIANSRPVEARRL